MSALSSVYKRTLILVAHFCTLEHYSRLVNPLHTGIQAYRHIFIGVYEYDRGWQVLCIQAYRRIFLGVYQYDKERDRRAISY